MESSGHFRPRGGRSLFAVQHVVKLKGTSQPSIVMASGGALYVVKFREFTGRYGLLSEVIGAELMSRIGLPVPNWEAIEFTDAFLDDHREMWYRDRSGAPGLRPEAGLHFGSRLTLSDGSNRTHELIPDAWAPRVSNRQDLVGALVLDLWTNNCDRRQCLFLTGTSPQSLRVVFIDNDHMFGGYFGNEVTCVRRTMVPAKGLYAGLWTAPSVGNWMRAIDGIDDAFLESVIDRVPPEWALEADRQFARTQLRARRRRLVSLIDEVENVLRTDGVPTVKTPRTAAEPSFLNR
jgi:hypothetical protein